jgi:acetyl esterase/lipase
MSERKYTQESIKELQEKVKVIQNYGIPIILKPSPGEEREGYLDPKEAIYAFEKPGEEKNLETKEDNSFVSLFNGENMPPLEVLIPMIREGMGFPNLNLNTVEMITEVETLNDSGNEVRLWRYYPRKTNKNLKRPAFLYIHGGAWIGGSVYTVENYCKLLSELSGAVVFNVDYSLAPEKPFPNGFNDIYETIKHIHSHALEYGIDPSKIGIGGDSAGGNLTAAVCLKLRDEGDFKPALQVLIYPAIAIGDVSVEGYEWSEDPYVIAPEQEKMIRGALILGRPSDIEKDPLLFTYVKEKKNIYHPYISPMLAESHTNLPRTLLFGAEFDGLRIQTEFYAKQLTDAGVKVTCYRYKGMTHAFLDRLGYVPQTEDLCIEVAKAIQEL